MDDVSPAKPEVSADSYSRRNTLTRVYHRVPVCGHKFAPGQEPRHRNCEPCWFLLFASHKELVEGCDEVFKQFGQEGLAQIRGPKFAKNYVKFMSTLASWKEVAEQSNQEVNAEVSS